MFTETYHHAAFAVSLLPVLLLVHGKAGVTRSAGGRSRARGFTLIEVMITVAIVGVLAAIALPSYREHVRKSRRAEAQAYLMTTAARQQQFLLDTRSYAGDLATIGIAVPANVVAAYDVTLATAVGPPPTFTLVATPKPDTDQVEERCGVLTINQTGAKTANLTNCW